MCIRDRADYDTGIRWDDTDIGIKWKTCTPIVSERDRNLRTFKQYLESEDQIR